MKWNAKIEFFYLGEKLTHLGEWLSWTCSHHRCRYDQHLNLRVKLKNNNNNKLKKEKQLVGKRKKEGNSTCKGMRKSGRKCKRSERRENKQLSSRRRHTRLLDGWTDADGTNMGGWMFLHGFVIERRSWRTTNIIDSRNIYRE